MEPIQKERKIYRYKNGHVDEMTDLVVSEYPLTIKVNGEEFSTIVSTPEYLEDLTLGFLASEGVIQSPDEVKSLTISRTQGVAHVEVQNLQRFRQLFRAKRVVTSCCGMSRQGFVFVNDELTAKKMEGVHVRVTFDECFHLIDELQQQSDLFQSTGGVHNASLCTTDGTVLSRRDIGRHNALDKIYGYCLREKIDLQDKIVVFSGRISSEILMKVAKIGCEIVLSKSAPTDLALTAAEELGITTIGFIRGESLNVYTRPDRVVNLD
ncbi:formate dehydrogenase accessory sulfurtransferase FdhD [Alicyclobacillus sp. SO9]|uniref:formate dehydrogenase accessory sulfurtransferase FdhD n=1 Tax=Alicyclobacillus sp. SO9 TaxID=2665646 RepID=UPI0018E6DF8E|nr:formate dehydrogenase accessory sulfurtransferase FdhD [Alicyclobacillus sp. SO9]QQE79829.1 formate dehydrogenase accessory sulfurtransferase FdhD [Alicyclobacillus sp. SO9]